MEELTKRQRAILAFVARHIKDKRFPPTIREIGKAMGIRSTNGVNDHLKALERKGFLTRGELKSRALFPSDAAWEMLGGPTTDVHQQSFPANDDLVEIPLLGHVAAGLPALAEEHHEATLRIDPSLLGSSAARKNVFALRVRGDSMIGDGIFDGDMLFVSRQSVARPGQIVVAMIEGEATVKRFYPEGDTVRFQPSNPNLAPIYVRKSDVRATTIVGVAVGVFRKVE